MKKSSNNANHQLMMLNINGDGLNVAYEDLLNYNPINKLLIAKPGAGSGKHSNAPHSAQPKKKKSSSAQASPHRNALKASKNISYPEALQVGLPARGPNENRPYSAKNSSYNRKKTGTLIKMLAKNDSDPK